MGVDCNLTINPNWTLTVQSGGCFHQDEPIESKWTLSGNRIILSDPALKNKFGPHLTIRKVGKNLVFVPQENERAVRQRGFHHHICFWKNLLGEEGLELPAETEAITKPAQ
jgi:hypothetical protein